jgi:hypothetical protein
MFEWDDAKNRENIAKHGVGFEVATQIFGGFVLTIEDDRFNYGEERSISIGMTNSMAVLVVAHTDRDEATRIITARRATRNERRRYSAALEEAKRS